MRTRVRLIACAAIALLCGCDRTLPLAAVQDSPWARDQQRQVAEFNRKTGKFQIESQEFWCGRIDRIDRNNVFLKPAKRIESRSFFSETSAEPIRIGFPEGDAEEFHPGDFLAVRVSVDLKQQLFARDWRVITALPELPESFRPICDRLIGIQLQHRLSFHYRLLNDRTLVVTCGAPERRKVHSRLPDGGWSKSADADAEIFPYDAFRLTVRALSPGESAPGAEDVPGVIVTDAMEDGLHCRLECGYGFSCDLFHALLPAAPPPNLLSGRGPRQEVMFESSGAIAMHPSTQARCCELQRAFEQAGFKGKWGVGDFGRMIYYGGTRSYANPAEHPEELTGPALDGCILTLSAPQPGWDAAPAPELQAAHAGERFLYWNFKCGNLQGAFERAGRQLHYKWTLEYGDRFPKDELVRMLRAVDQCGAWELPDRKPRLQLPTGIGRPI